MIIAGTGHRPNKLGGYGAEVQQKLIDFAAAVLPQHQPSTVITGMALGWDMALAQAAVRLGIPFHAYIPFNGQELMWPESTRLYYRALMRQAQHIVVCSTGGFTKEAMQVRNVAMVDNCDELVALWNGSSGGTANCLRYAQSLHKRYTNYWPEWSMDLVPGTASEDWLQS